MAVLDFLDDELAALERAHRRRIPRVVTGAQGAHLVLDGREVVSFSSNDYLGFAARPELAAAMAGGLETSGVGAGASRLIVGNSTHHEELEGELATLLSRPAARLFNSGYAANTGLLPVLANDRTEVFSDELNHASLIDGCRLARATRRVYRHNNYNELEYLLSESLALRKLIVTESLFSMDGDVADLSVLRRLATDYRAILVVDDAHAVGLFEAGAGLASAGGADVIVGTLGKALGCYGACVAGPKSLADVLWTRARSLVFSTGLPPAVAAAGVAAVRLARGREGDAARTRLWRAVDQLRAGLEELGLVPGNRSPIVPLRVGDDRVVMDWTTRLLAQGIYVQGIRPPTVPEGTARLRVAMSAGHSEEDVGRLLAALKDGLAAGLPLRST